MKWTVLETILSPETGMSFTLITSLKGTRFILWHAYSEQVKPQRDLFIQAGKIWLYYGENVTSLKIYQSNLYAANLWESMRKHAGCDKYLQEGNCSFQDYCVLGNCPWQRPKR